MQVVALHQQNWIDSADKGRKHYVLLKVFILILRIKTKYNLIHSFLELQLHFTLPGTKKVWLLLASYDIQKNSSRIAYIIMEILEGTHNVFKTGKKGIQNKLAQLALNYQTSNSI